MSITEKALEILKERDRGWLRTGVVVVEGWVLEFALAHGELHCIITCAHCGKQSQVLGKYPQCFKKG